MFPIGGHSIAPDHTVNSVDVQWSSFGPQDTLLLPLRSPTGSVLSFNDLTVLPSVKAYLVILSIVILSLYMDTAIVWLLY